MKHARWYLVLVVVHACDYVAAANPPDDIELGRVFMTADERKRLDRLRQNPLPQITVAESDAGDDVDSIAEAPLPASGFIISSQGGPYKWIDGGFRKVSAEQILAQETSRNIRITSHNHSSAKSNPDIESDVSREAIPATEQQDDHGMPH